MCRKELQSNPHAHKLYATWTINDSVPTWHRFSSGMSVLLAVLGEIRYEFHVVFLEPSWVISMISEIDGRVGGVQTFSMAGWHDSHVSCCAEGGHAAQEHKCVAHYSSTILLVLV